MHAATLNCLEALTSAVSGLLRDEDPDDEEIERIAEDLRHKLQQVRSEVARMDEFGGESHFRALTRAMLALGGLLTGRSLYTAGARTLGRRELLEVAYALEGLAEGDSTERPPPGEDVEYDEGTELLAPNDAGWVPAGNYGQPQMVKCEFHDGTPRMHRMRARLQDGEIVEVGSTSEERTAELVSAVDGALESSVEWVQER